MGGIDATFTKSDKEIAAHVLSNLPKGYKSVKTILEMDDDHLDDLDKVKKRITKHWKTNYRKKSKKKSRYSSSSESSDDSSSESESSESTKRNRRSRRKKDKHALNITDPPKQDRRN